MSNLFPAPTLNQEAQEHRNQVNDAARRFHHGTASVKDGVVDELEMAGISTRAVSTQGGCDSASALGRVEVRFGCGVFVVLGFGY
jgi:hypothetical protein